MKPRFMQLLETCIIDGVSFGHAHAYKHNDAPAKHEINEAIVNAVLIEIHEWFEFDDEIVEKNK
jgi:hypothetical protein